MNLVEFVRKHDIKCTEGAEFEHSPDFERMKAFERKAYRIPGVPFIAPETYKVGEFEVRLRGRIQEKWSKRDRRTRRQFFVDRFFHYPDVPEELTPIEDSVPAGKTIDEALECLRNEMERFLFFRRYDLIDTGRYWLNRDLKRCVVDEGKVVVMD